MSERKPIYFGSLAEQEKARLENKHGSSQSSSGSSALEIAKKAGNINIGNKEETEVMDLSESSKAAQLKHAETLRRYEAEVRARSIAVPTTIEAVIQKLRELGEPVTLFGENAADRRERLREVMARRQLEGEDEQKIEKLLREQRQKEEKEGIQPEKATVASAPAAAAPELFYTPGGEDLKRARQEIAAFSFPRSLARLKRSKLLFSFSDEGEKAMDDLDRHAADLLSTAKKVVISSSQVGDERPLCSVRFHPESDLVATGSWSNLVKIWDSTTSEEKLRFKGHTERITGLAWNPKSKPDRAFGQSSNASVDMDVENGSSPEFTSGVDLVTGSADSSAMLWSLTSTKPVRRLQGHEGRLGQVAFHPSGHFVGTAGFDLTWRLWNVETGAQLLLQEGHTSEVYAIAFQQDGALVATGDLSGIGRMWDLRSGKTIMDLVGHARKILAADWSPNGYHLATGSDDHSIRIWDIRKKQCLYVLPAHTGLVSDVRFAQQSGEILVSSSYDGTASIICTRDWTKLKSIAGHEGKIMAVDIAKDEKHFVTAGFDRTFKLWSHAKEF